MAGFTERATVQDPLVRYAAEAGWASVAQAEQLILRKGEAGLFFYQVLQDKLIEFNPEVVTESNVDDIIRRMESVRGSIEGNEDIEGYRKPFSVSLLTGVSVPQ